jgi:MFS family permease
VLGLGLGTVVPAAFGAAGRIARSRGRTALAIVVTAGYVGSIVGPLVVGFVADRAGLRAAFTIPVAAALVAALTLRTPVARAGT